MKIICEDNYNREHISDVLIAENVNEFYGKIIVKFLLSKYTSRTTSEYFKLVEDDHQLYVFTP